MEEFSNDKHEQPTTVAQDYDDDLLIEEENPTATATVTTTDTAVENAADTDTSHVKGFQNTSDSKQVVDLSVTGQLPEWLTGEVYTIGPGIYDVRYSRKIEIDNILQSSTHVFTMGHWFDALPLVNRFDFNGERNTVTYRNHLTNKRLIQKIRDHHGYAPSFPAGLFKTDPNQTMLIKFLNNGKKPKPDRVPCGQRISTQIPGVDGRLFCQDFANHVQELDPFDLQPTRVQGWDEINPNFKGYSSSSNGQYDANTGEYINFTMEIGYRSTKYHFFGMTEQQPKGEVIATIWNAPTGFVNHFALTPRYIVMVIHPVLANTAAVKFAWNESILDSFDFYKSEPTLFYVISREAKDVIACYRAPASFSMNGINAFEDVHGNIQVDMVCYDDDEMIKTQLTTQHLRTNTNQVGGSEARRYTLTQPMQDAHSVYVANNSFIPSAISMTSRIGSVWNYVRGTNILAENATSTTSGWHAWMPVIGYQTLSPVSLELPHINPNYKLKNYEFVYGIGFIDENNQMVNTGSFWNSIMKVNTESKQVVASWHEEHCYPSEAQFIPKPFEDKMTQQEDAGVLVSVVMDSKRSTSFVLVLDAQGLEEIARIELNKLIPLSFAHGCYKLRSA